MSSNVEEQVEKTVEYGVEHLGRSMADTTMDTLRATMRRRYKTRLFIAAWRGYANLFLNITKDVGTGQAAPNLANVRQTMKEGGDA